MSIATILGRLGKSSTLLPLFSCHVPAGFPSPAQDHLEQVLSLDELLDIRAPHIYLVRAGGHSMIDVGIFDGDILVVSRGQNAVDGEIVIAALNGDPFVKRLVIQGDATILQSENPQYPPRYIMEGDQLDVWGVVIASLRRHAHHG